MTTVTGESTKCSLSGAIATPRAGRASRSDPAITEMRLRRIGPAEIGHWALRRRARDDGLAASRVTMCFWLRAAVSLADEIGIDAFSMRRLAQELDVVAMAGCGRRSC